MPLSVNGETGTGKEEAQTIGSTGGSKPDYAEELIFACCAEI